ncbi:unnamed protein product, partial [Dicrocoelium dendriticum]
ANEFVNNIVLYVDVLAPVVWSTTCKHKGQHKHLNKAAINLKKFKSSYGESSSFGKLLRLPKALLQLQRLIQTAKINEESRALINPAK